MLGPFGFSQRHCPEISQRLGHEAGASVGSAFAWGTCRVSANSSNGDVYLALMHAPRTCATQQA